MDSKHVLNYMDDILIMTKTYEEHLKVINQLFWRLRQAGLRISPKKVNFMQSSIKYLGYVFDKDGVRADPAKMEALVKLPAPKNIKNVREVMGCLNYYRRFVKDFSKISQPINELLKKDMPYSVPPNLMCTPNEYCTRRSARPSAPVNQRGGNLEQRKNNMRTLK